MTEIEIIENMAPLYKSTTAKKSIRHDFFKEIKTELQAYLLGFIFADGSVDGRQGANRLCIHINEKDSEIFKMLKVISPEASILNDAAYESKAEVRGRTVKNKGSKRLSIHSKILVHDLINLGCYEAKTYKELSIPKIDEKLVRHFIRGYFDGDGSFTYGIRKPNPKYRQKNYRLTQSFQICSKKSNILNEIAKFCEDNKIKAGVSYYTRDDMYLLTISSKDGVKKFGELLYNDSNYFLSRKKNKFNYYANTEESQIITDLRNA
jgi:intein/homing endonuclease